MKITKKQLKQIIKEELGDILREVRTRRRGAHYRKYVYPHNKAPRFSVGDDGKPKGKDDINSFKKFYAAVKKAAKEGDSTARRQLGRRDYRWGQKHSDAYATLTGRFGAVGVEDENFGPAGIDKGPEASKIAIDDETAKQVRSVGTEVGRSRVFTDELAHAISVNAKMARKSEKYEAQVERIMARVKQIIQDPESGEQEFKEMQKLNKKMERMANLATQAFGASIGSGYRAQGLAGRARRAEEAFPGFNARHRGQALLAKEFFDHADILLRYIEHVKPGLVQDFTDKSGYQEGAAAILGVYKEDPQWLAGTFDSDEDWKGAMASLKTLEKLQTQLTNRIGRAQGQSADTELYTQTDATNITAGKPTTGGGEEGIVQTENPPSTDKEELMKELEHLRDIKRVHGAMLKKQGKMSRLNKMIKNATAKLKAAGAR